MRKFKSAAAAFLIIALIAAISPSASSAGGEIIVVALENGILAPNPDTMPFQSGGVIYILPELLKSEFSLQIVDDREGGSYFITGLGQILFYDMNEKTVTDKAKNRYSFESYKPVLKNGRYYVPAAFFCEVFNLSYKKFSYAPLLMRINRAGQGKTDAAITAAYKAGITNLLTKYYDTYPEEPGAAGYGIIEHSIYFVVSGDCPGKDTASILDALKAAGEKALFVVRGDKILENEALVRRIYVEGHGIAVGAYGEAGGLTPKAYVAGAEKTNDALEAVLKMRTKLVFLPEDISDKAKVAFALAAAGYQVWSANIPAYGGGKDGQTPAAAVIAAVKKIRRPTVLEFSDNPEAAATLAEVIKYLKTRSCAYNEITEFVTPPVSLK